MKRIFLAFALLLASLACREKEDKDQIHLGDYNQDDTTEMAADSTTIMPADSAAVDTTVTDTAKADSPAANSQE